MAIYNVEIVEKLSRVVEQEANSYEEAENLVQEKYDNEEIILDWNDCEKVEYKKYPYPKIKNNLTIYFNFNKDDNSVCIQNIQNFFDSGAIYNCKTKEDLKMVFNSFIDDHIDFDNNNENEVLKNIEDTFRKTMDKLYKEDRKHKIELVKQAQKNREKER